MHRFREAEGGLEIGHAAVQCHRRHVIGGGEEGERLRAVLFYNDESEAELSFRAAIKSGGRKALLADGAVASTLARSLQKFMMAR